MEIRFSKDPTPEKILKEKKWSYTSQKILELIKIKGPITRLQIETITGYKLSTVRSQLSILKRMGLIDDQIQTDLDNRQNHNSIKLFNNQSNELIEKNHTLSLKEIPRLARDDSISDEVFKKQALLPTWHKLFLGDSRKMADLDDDSVHLVVTSPPYWILKPYPPIPGQLGVIQDYTEFLNELSKIISECYRVLIPGGRFICVVGDVCIPRRKIGKHLVYPLHSDITIRARSIGFDNLTPILWYKIANAKYEANTYSTILGKPYEPNAVIKNDVEFILIQKKPGPYRKPTIEQRKLSYIPRIYYEQWFRQIWNLGGASTREHPAPFPFELALRLIRMYSFVDDIILDPFVGTSTTMLAAMKSGRNSIGYEIDPKYVEIAKKRLMNESSKLFQSSKIYIYKNRTLNSD